MTEVVLRWFCHLFFWFFGPMWAHKGPYRPGSGPYEGEQICQKICLSKIVAFDLHVAFFNSFNVFLQISGQNTFQNDYKITSKSKFSNQNVQFWYLHHPALSNSLMFLRQYCKINVDIFCIVLPCSLDLWPKYASERLWNYLKKQVWESKRAGLVPLSPCLNYHVLG